MIKIEGLTKEFGNGKGIFDVTFEVKQGEVFGFLGPNGAGKSTTIRHLMGFIKPSKGAATINGFDCWKEADQVKKHVGYLPGEIAFPEEMTAYDFIRLIAGMKGMSDLGRAEEFIEKFQLDMRVHIKKMSKGMKQKLAIVAAFLHNPDILILDEPSTGLDPLMQNILVDFILEEKKCGKTILISSHIFDEIKDTADTICIIKNGKIVESGDLKTLKSAQKRYLKAYFTQEVDVELLQRSNLQIEKVENLVATILIQQNINEIMRELMKYDLINVEIMEPEIKDIFIKHYENR
ncbi:MULTISPECIES: cereulide export ABC transporter permease ATP-binding protein CesC [Bacillus cereus group]|uniref:cereulide export ABC transporter permease ATP-binding protein CesC n=1 Tax=Bacillus cereus group TaxID=86661 RepID=UPI0013D89FC1|nr:MULTISPECIES: cereulide export ABC transporter permease ATP-binding protein CesC [Bacillus cereus group]MDK7437287.1 cereulide export ABC transporter permease ATP-binding protein CesC [Bacillus paranthracis]MDK7470360.1 cereulide export ABC transporter permease ATP-binding protein CesC [Bacillus paranthracis]MDK7486553.1 cereulide export ABC transporter permease ATP-binding protein CesC [Bacillus paranthracis]MDK7497090.1 cereulide export ABC transporter permease ATP-binding protein CesC [Ba